VAVHPEKVRIEATCDPRTSAHPCQFNDRIIWLVQSGATAADFLIT